MSNEEELKKAAAAEINRHGGLGNALGYSECATQVSPTQDWTLLDRLRKHRDHLKGQASQACLVDELVHLLEENPAVARILHLLDITGNR